MEETECLDSVADVYLAWARSIIQSSLPQTLDDLTDGKLLLRVLGELAGIPDSSSSPTERFKIIRSYFSEKSIDCQFDEGDAISGEAAVLLDILWCLMLNFTICPGEDVSFDDKCVELGRCLLLEWINLICGDDLITDPDRELPECFAGNKVLVNIIEHVFCVAEVELPEGDLRKQILYVMLLVEEAIGISHKILNVDELLDGSVPEFALVVYLSLLKSRYMADKSLDNWTKHSLADEIIEEHPSQEFYDELTPQLCPTKLPNEPAVFTAVSSITSVCPPEDNLMKIPQPSVDTNEPRVTSQASERSCITSESGFISGSQIDKSPIVPQIDTADTSLDTDDTMNENSFFCKLSELNPGGTSTDRHREDAIEKLDAVEECSNRKNISSSASNRTQSTENIREFRSQTASSSTEENAFENHQSEEVSCSEKTPESCHQKSGEDGDDVLMKYVGKHVPCTQQFSFEDYLSSRGGKISLMDDSRNSTDPQITVIEKDVTQNVSTLSTTHSIPSSRIEKIISKTETSDRKPVEHPTAAHRTVSCEKRDSTTKHTETVEYSMQQPKLSEVVDVDDEAQIENFVPKTTPEHILKARASPSSDPLMQLLDSIADRGKSLQSELNESYESSFRDEIIAVDTRLNDGLKNVDIIGKLEQQLNFVISDHQLLEEEYLKMKLDKESEERKSARLMEEVERLEKINRSFREDNLKMEEKILFLEKSFIASSKDLAEEKAELERRAEELRKAKESQEALGNVINVDERDATIIGLQHELEESLFEKSRIQMELEHTRELLKQRDWRQLKEDADRDEEIIKLSKSFGGTFPEHAEEKIQEMNETISKLEEALKESQQRNSALNAKLDASSDFARLTVTESVDFETQKYPLSVYSYNDYCNCLKSSKFPANGTCLDVMRNPVPMCTHHCNCTKSGLSFAATGASLNRSCNVPTTTSDFHYFDESLYTHRAAKDGDVRSVSWSELPGIPPQLCSHGLASSNPSPKEVPQSSHSFTGISRTIPYRNTVNTSHSTQTSPLPMDSPKQETRDNPLSNGIVRHQPFPVEPPDVPEHRKKEILESIISKYASESSTPKAVNSDARNSVPGTTTETQSLVPTHRPKAGEGRIKALEYKDLRTATRDLAAKILSDSRDDTVNSEENVTVIQREPEPLRSSLPNFDEFTGRGSGDVALKPLLQQALQSAGLTDIVTQKETEERKQLKLAVPRVSEAAPATVISPSIRSLPTGDTSRFHALYKSDSNRTQSTCSSNNMSVSTQNETSTRRPPFFHQSSLSAESSGVDEPLKAAVPSNNVEMEILERYRKQLNIQTTTNANGQEVIDRLNPANDSFIRGLHDSILENLKNIKNESAVYKSKITPPPLLTTRRINNREGEAKLQKPIPKVDVCEESFRPIQSSHETNHLISSEREEQFVKNYLSHLDHKYPVSGGPGGKGHPGQPMRTSTPTRQRTSSSPPPHFDISHISLASTCVAPGSIDAGAKLYDASPRSANVTSSSKFITPRVQFA